MKSIHHTPATELEYNEIIPGLYVGTNQCCQSQFAKELQDMNIEADMSIEGERIDSAFGAQFFVWIPVIDKHAPSQAQLEFAVNCLETWQKMGINVFLHCQNGHGRAPTVAAAFIMKTKSLSALDAIEFVRSKRPAMHLESVQIAALKEFEERIDN